MYRSMWSVGRPAFEALDVGAVYAVPFFALGIVVVVGHWSSGC
jgi:hypothetical protein